MGIVAVPISRLPDLIEKSKAEFEKSGLHTTIVSHALDGNFRNPLQFVPLLMVSRWNNVSRRSWWGGDLTLRLYDIDKKGDRRKAEEIVHNMVDSAIEMEGTCTGGRIPRS
jgi:D-lactate dehydrogenase (cytochrome)